MTQNSQFSAFLCHEVRLKGFFIKRHKRYVEKQFVSLHIQSKRGKIWTRKTPNTNTFYAVFKMTERTNFLAAKLTHLGNSSSDETL